MSGIATRVSVPCCDRLVLLGTRRLGIAEPTSDWDFCCSDEPETLHVVRSTYRMLNLEYSVKADKTKVYFSSPSGINVMAVPVSVMMRLDEAYVRARLNFDVPRLRVIRARMAEKGKSKAWFYARIGIPTTDQLLSEYFRTGGAHNWLVGEA